MALLGFGWLWLALVGFGCFVLGLVGFGLSRVWVALYLVCFVCLFLLVCLFLVSLVVFSFPRLATAEFCLAMLLYFLSMHVPLWLST